MDKQKQMKLERREEKAVRQSYTKEGAFVDLLNQEMRELQDSMKQKQIEEMAKDLKEEKLYALINKTSYMRSAENLINAGYLKIPENAVWLTREEYAKHKGFSREEVDEISKTAIKNSRKEMAEKFARRLKEMLHYDIIPESGITDEKNVFECIDEICKELREGNND